MSGVTVFKSRKKKKNHFFVKMAKNYFRGPFQNGANSACPGSPFLSPEKKKKNHFFVKMVKNSFRGPFQNGANSACPGSPFLSPEKKKKSLFCENG